ncbi:MAG: hypothetical protein E5X34_19670 [Mesorhizobium sp.]|uniref:hypothetical protein n=1 Tax=Mesorhizobium sp. TaxID=1871066 RepID=UPI0012107035|nr:hypothetical protein [Mesorhizobium sp.]TIR19557.1 MAG: hypothetical protein E5X34_19670 [Mesorhizobium sp.]
MVRLIPSRANSIKFGSVALSVDELIQIIEGQQFSKVSAKNKSIAFDDLADLKKNKALLVGNPTLRCDDIGIDFDGFFGQSINIYGNSEHSYSAAKAIEAEFRARKTIGDYVRDNQKIVTIPYWFVLASFIGIKLSDKKSPSMDVYFEFFTSKVVPVVFSIAFIIYLNAGYIHYIRKAVYYRASEGFFRRNIEKIIVGAIGIIVGAGIKSILDRF